MLEPKNAGEDAIILEFKVFQPRKEKDLQDTVEAALRQIEEKSYVADLIGKGVTEDHIRRYGFAFCGKEVLIAGGYFPKSTGSTGDSGSGGGLGFKM